MTLITMEAGDKKRYLLSGHLPSVGHVSLSHPQLRFRRRQPATVLAVPLVSIECGIQQGWSGASSGRDGHSAPQLPVF